MKRTQIYLDEDMVARLADESRRRGTTVSAIVREAVAKDLGRTLDIEARLKLVDEVAGLWADRKDLGDTETYVRELRRSSREERWGGMVFGEVSPRLGRRDRVAPKDSGGRRLGSSPRRRG